jgi:hypothetical protein
VIDFGISRIVSQEAHEDLKFFNYVNVVGLSARYAAPEVFARVTIGTGGQSTDPITDMKGDVYAFSVW